VPASHNGTAVLPAVAAGPALPDGPALPATQSFDTQLLRAEFLRDEPADEPDGAPPSRHRRLLVPLVGLLAVAAIVFGIVQTFGADTPAASTSPAPTTSAAPTPAPAPRLLLASANYVGRPVGEVQAELTVFGLTVTLRPLTTTDVPDGTVIAVDPLGELSPGSPVTLTHAVAPPPAPEPEPAPAPAPETVVVTQVPEPGSEEGDGNWWDDEGSDRNRDEDGDKDGDKDRDKDRRKGRDN
jgi:serine/threonine-protein kinase